MVAQRAAVLAAFARLSENDREILRLIAWDGLTHARDHRPMSLPAGVGPAG